MSDHPSSRKLLDLVDGGLSRAEEERLSEHIASCTNCSRYVETVRRVISEASASLCASPRSDARDRILERWCSGDRVILPVADPEPRPSRSRMGPLLAAPVIALLVAVTLLLWK